MKITKLFYILFFLAFVGHLQAQDNLQTIQQGSIYPFNLTINGDQLIIISNPSHGVVEMSNVGNVYTGTFTPDPDYVGFDQFILQEISFAPPSSKKYPFDFNIVESMVDTEDDFIKLTSGQPVTFDPAVNDASSASALDLSIAHVMYGSAEVNDDNTITYTPGDSDLDYIVYNGSDMYGTSSSSTIYISQEGEQPTEDSQDEFKIPSGDSKHIMLPWSGYTIDDSDLEFGLLEQVNDYVWTYTANDGADGQDILVFSNDEGLTHTVDAEVIEKYVDDGFVKDDVFFSAKNTQLEFNVKDNDIDGQTVIVDYSEELVNQGDGNFSFTPEPGETGVFEFFYTASTGSEDEDGSIEIVVGNITPSASADYTLSTPKNQPRVIEYDVPLGTEYFEVENYPAHGTIEVFGSDDMVELGCEEEVQKVFAVYTPNDDFVGADDVVLRYFASGNNLPTYSTIVIVTEDSDVDDCICVDDCVWPGDANGDGNVNIRDVLSIGRYIGSAGESRDESPYGETYEGVKVPNWDGEQTNGKSIGHADANGDGLVTIEDLQVVSDNYNDVNTLVSTDLFGVKNVPFNFISGGDAGVGEVKEIFISVGSNSSPVIDMSGVAFTINLPENNVDVNSVKFEFYEDNFFVKGAPYTSLTHVYDNAIVEAAGIKTNGVGSTGNGIIGVLSFIVIEDAEGIRPAGRSSNSSNNDMIELTNIIFEDGAGRQYSVPSTFINLEIEKDEPKVDQSFNIFPNPVNDNVTVESKNGTNIQSLQIRSVTGELIDTYNNVGQASRSINMSTLDMGMYIFSITNETETQSIKVIKG